MTSLVETYVNELTADKRMHEWVRYHRVPEGELDQRMAAIAQAAHQVKVPDLHLHVVPATDSIAPVATLPSTAVIRVANFPPPWAAS